MLGAVLVLAAIQLVAAWGCYALARRAGVAGFILAVLGGLLGFFVSVGLSIVLALQFVLLTLLGFGCLAWRTRPRTFLLSGVVASLVAIVAAGIWSAQRWSALQHEYPIESLAGRLAYESRRANLSKDQVVVSETGAVQRGAALSAERLTRLDESYNQRRGWSSYYIERVRTESLRLVHASRVQQFVDSEGFGVGRMPRPSPDAIDYVRAPRLLPMPADVAPSTSADHEQNRNPAPVPLADALESEMGSLHGKSLGDFANPAGFGYIESRQRVVGFLPHAFSQPLELPMQLQWTIGRVELVSLLKHDKPMVYVSANLPNMAELREVPVRPLDRFEQTALTSLLAGEELKIESTAERIRMLGGIRAAKQCLECHTVDHGALLGAFSYELRPTDIPPPPAVEQEPSPPAL